MKPSARKPLRSERGRLSALAPLAALLLAIAGSPAADAGQQAMTFDGAPAATASPTPYPRLMIPIPVSHDAQVVKLPMYDQRGKLQMDFYISKALRLDENHLQMREAYMQTYDAKQTPDMDIYMARAILDLQTRIVTSDVPVTVRRSDFQIVGQRMMFDTQKRKGHMTGHVKMVIYNRQAMTSPTPSPTPSAVSSQPLPSVPTPFPK